MRIRALIVCVLGLAASTAQAQGYDLAIHLGNGQTVTIPTDEVVRIEFANIVSGITDGPVMPSAFRMLGNYPNPFNPATTIVYEIPTAGEVSVRIFNLRGALIRDLLRTAQAAGRHEIVWDGTGVAGGRIASGVYLCAVTCDGQTRSRPMILVK